MGVDDCNNGGMGDDHEGGTRDSNGGGTWGQDSGRRRQTRTEPSLRQVQRER